jgi:hypothetical protein
MDLVYKADFCLNQNEKGQGFFSDLEWGAKTGWEGSVTKGAAHRSHSLSLFWP